MPEIHVHFHLAEDNRIPQDQIAATAEILKSINPSELEGLALHKQEFEESKSFTECILLALVEVLDACSS